MPENKKESKEESKEELIIIKEPSPPSMFYEFKKSIGLQEYSDGSFILYFFLAVFIIQKVNDLFSFIKNIIVLPKQVIDTYYYITKEDLILLDRIDDLMNQLLGVLDADRIAVAKIHNGTYDNTNAHIMKFSMIYEVISNRVLSNKSSVQNISLDFIKEEINLGSTECFQRFDRSKLNSLCDLYLDRIGINTKYYKLLSIKNRIYGMLEIHLVEEPKDDFTTDIALSKRVYKITNELEDCLQSILIKRTWLQKTVAKLFKINNLFK